MDAIFYLITMLENWCGIFSKIYSQIMHGNHGYKGSEPCTKFTDFMLIVFCSITE